MGNRYSVREDEFEWNLGAKRRLRRYICEAGLSYSEAGKLLGVSRGAIASAAYRFGLQLPLDEQIDRKRRQAYERALHPERKRGTNWDTLLVETWSERKQRLKREGVK